MISFKGSTKLQSLPAVNTTLLFLMQTLLLLTGITVLNSGEKLIAVLHEIAQRVPTLPTPTLSWRYPGLHTEHYCYEA
jgi:hypothetical protein